MTRRVAIVGAWHETNTFSSRPTALADFDAFELLAGDALAEHNRGTRTVIGGYLDAVPHFAEAVPVFAAGAWPSGPVEAVALDAILDRTERGLRRSGGVDAVLLNLHGAMVGERVDDVEMALVETVRGVVGDVPVGAVLDLHANPSTALAAAADVLVSYDTFPHVDMYERGHEVAGLVGQVLDGRHLRTTIRKVPLLVCPVAQSTQGGPLGELQRRAVQRAERAGLARVCVVGGFAYSDVERAGMSVLAVHDADHAAAAAQVLDETVRDILDRAAEFHLARPDAATAVAQAMAARARPVFLADVADNIGGGSPGDGTVLLAELLRAGARDAVVTLADADVARAAEHAGVGAELDVALGGKVDRRHGDPVHVRARVRRVTDGRYRSGGYYMTGQEFGMGTTAVLDVAGNTVVVTERAVPPFHAEQLSSVGVDASAASIVVVKGALAWREAFRGVPGEVIEVATPGICPVDVADLQRRTIPVTV